ncbi:hypothetical protein C8J56DRAFT_938669 [Mycena floridula]|nr:hypothetical protein C8J56DRAFT_938669 [Mycena floridula]
MSRSTRSTTAAAKGAQIARQTAAREALFDRNRHDNIVPLNMVKVGRQGEEKRFVTLQPNSTRLDEPQPTLWVYLEESATDLSGIAQVLEARSDGPDIYLRVAEAYWPEQAIKALKEHNPTDKARLKLLKDFGVPSSFKNEPWKHELILSNATRIISMTDAVEQAYVRFYDSGAEFEQLMTGLQWMIRFCFDVKNNRITHIFPGPVSNGCPCGKPYRPWDQRQVHCLKCKRWYHVDGCTEHMEPSIDTPFNDRDVVSSVLHRAIIRGYGPNDYHPTIFDNLGKQHDRDSFVVGPLRIVRYFQHLYQQNIKVLPDDWQDCTTPGWTYSATYGWPKLDLNRRRVFASRWLDLMRFLPALEYCCKKCHNVLNGYEPV